MNNHKAPAFQVWFLDALWICTEPRINSPNDFLYMQYFWRGVRRSNHNTSTARLCTTDHALEFCHRMIAIASCRGGPYRTSIASEHHRANNWSILCLFRRNSFFCCWLSASVHSSPTDLCMFPSQHLRCMATPNYFQANFSCFDSAYLGGINPWRR